MVPSCRHRVESNCLGSTLHAFLFVILCNMVVAGRVCTVDEIVKEGANDCTMLDGDGQALTVEGATALADALMKTDAATNPKLAWIDLRSSSIGNKGLVALADALALNTQLKTIYFQANAVGDEGAVALAGVLKDHPGIRKLDLSWNLMGDAGAAALAEALKVNTNLLELNLNYQSPPNNIGNEGATALVRSNQSGSMSRERANRVVVRPTRQCLFFFLTPPPPMFLP